MCRADSNGKNSHAVPSATAAEARRSISPETVINLDHGDPTVFEAYWKMVGERADLTISGHQSLSYFADLKKFCWFLEPKLEQEIRRLHEVVGNAKAEGHHVVVGNGSSQLLQAALYALSPKDQPDPVSVVSAAPFYSCYPEVTDFVRSGLYKWEGDARIFDKEGTYIEMVTSPNNPSGVMQEPVVNRDHGSVVYDLAYYWPHYTPIATKLDFDIMLFTVSKCTGHAGSRIGWALVRDEEVAKKMTKFMEISTIGVSKEAQLRAAKIMGIVSDSCQNVSDLDNFFEYSKALMTERWEALRDVVKRTGLFNLPKYPLQYCHFTGQHTEAHPAFAWMSCRTSTQDCEKILRGHKVAVRGGRRFGSDPNYARISMLSKEEEFNQFLERLSAIQEIGNGN